MTYEWRLAHGLWLTEEAMEPNLSHSDFYNFPLALNHYRQEQAEEALEVTQKN